MRQLSTPSVPVEDVRLLCNRLKAIRDEARNPKRDFNLDWQLGRLLDDLEKLARMRSSDLDAIADASRETP